MNRFFHYASLVLCVALLFTVAGCGGDDKKDATTGNGDAEQELTDEQKIEAALAELSPEDAAAAKAQKICPVSGEPLGSMGAPPKVDVEGKAVWICCAGCKDALLEKPEEHMAKLKTGEQDEK